jgi:hypothetical protein
VEHLGVACDGGLVPLACGDEVDELGDDAVGVVFVVDAADDDAVASEATVGCSKASISETSRFIER